MPLILDETVLDHARYGVWRIDEASDFFAGRMTLSDAEQALVAKLRTPQQREWLASRFVLDQICDHRTRIETASLPTGKPYLIGRPEEISLSHSGAYVAAMVGIRDVGIDIQLCKDKITRLEHKFARPEESERIDRTQAVLHLHLLWGAKETLYKIYAKKQLHFLRHLHVDLPVHLAETGSLSGVIYADGQTIRCVMEYRILNNYVLVYGEKKL